MGEQQQVREGAPVERVRLQGDIMIPADALGVVLFAHGSGSSRHSPRNRFVARCLNEARIGTLLLDLLTSAEEPVDRATGTLRFDVDLLARRLIAATRWLRKVPQAANLPIGYFGASTGAGAALVAAAWQGDEIRAVVSRGGRPDLAGDALEAVRAPTLLLVGEMDEPVIRMNQKAAARLKCPNQLTIIPGATHLFEEEGTLEEAARQAAEWFEYFLPRRQ